MSLTAEEDLKSRVKQLKLSLRESPVELQGHVVSGYQRGRLMGFPTANLDEQSCDEAFNHLPNGVYFGFAQVDNSPVYPMVMSLGTNPVFGNQHKTVEVHILHSFPHDFYGAHMCVLIVGYLRPEMMFTSVDKLKAAIVDDIKKSQKRLNKDEDLYRWKFHPCFRPTARV